jgi:hypothetical protein
VGDDMKIGGNDISKIMFGGIEVIKALFSGIEVFTSVPPVVPPENLVVYNPDTYAEWGVSGGTKDSTGISLTTGSSYCSIPVIVAPNTKYGSLLRIVTNGLTSTLVTLGHISSNLTIAPAGVIGYRKNVFTSKASISTFQWGFYPNSAGGVKIAEIRLFLLPAGSEIEADFANLTADQLNTKYPYAHSISELYNLTWDDVGDMTLGGI